MALMRLQKFLSSAGIASRRKAEELIQKGEVEVNGVVVTRLGTKIDSQKDKITFNRKAVALPQEHTYIMINKPRGYITTVTDPHKRCTVIDLVPKLKKKVYPVGRLDQDTNVLLLLTDDGQLAYRLSHPKFGVEKLYEVQVKGNLSPEDILKLEGGMELEGKVTARSEIKVISSCAGKTKVKFKLHEGKKRQIRLMFKAINRPVISLKRIEYGGLKLNNLKEGASRCLSYNEINLLKKRCGLENVG